MYIYFSQYGREKEDQGVAVARVPWADLDDPVGKVTIWNDGVWLPPTSFEDESGQVHWEYPHATAIQPTTKPWHTGEESNAFWGPSIHWNDWLQRYVMLLNRTNGDGFGQEGIYVSFNLRLDDPLGWSTPYKILEGGSVVPAGRRSRRGARHRRVGGPDRSLFHVGPVPVRHRVRARVRPIQSREPREMNRWPG